MRWLFGVPVAALLFVSALGSPARADWNRPGMGYGDHGYGDRGGWGHSWGRGRDWSPGWRGGWEHRRPYGHRHYDRGFWGGTSVIIAPGYGYYPAPVIAPPPPPIYVPAPVYVPPAPRVYTLPQAQQPYCREYQGDAVINGSGQPFYGTACLQPDGSWQIVN